MERKAYDTACHDLEWEFVAPYLTFMTPDAPQRTYELREVFNGLRWLVRAGAAWRLLPHDLPPWPVVYQQTQRWIRAGVFEAMNHDLRRLLRWHADRDENPTAAIIDSRTLQSTPTSGARAGFDGAKRRKGSRVHLLVDTLGHLLALHATAANEDERAQVAALCAAAQAATDDALEIVYADQGYTGPRAAVAAVEHGIELELVKYPEAKQGFVLVPRRWVVERTIGWAARFRRLARNYERLVETLEGLHYAAFGILFTKRLVRLAT